jgi:hypothetical protein
MGRRLRCSSVTSRTSLTLLAIWFAPPTVKLVRDAPSTDCLQKSFFFQITRRQLPNHRDGSGQLHSLVRYIPILRPIS